MKMREEFYMEYTNQKNTAKEAAMLFIGLFVGLVVIFDAAMYDSSRNNNPDVPMAVIFSAVLTLVVFGLVRTILPTYYEADESSVTIHHWWMIIRINYSDISGICLQRYNKLYKYDLMYCVERLSILTDKGKLYVFDTGIEVDHEKTANDPAALQMQFDNAKLSRLKKYIMYNRSQYISGRELITDPAAMNLPEMVF